MWTVDDLCMLGCILFAGHAGRLKHTFTPDIHGAILVPIAETRGIAKYPGPWWRVVVVAFSLSLYSKLVEVRSLNVELSPAPVAPTLIGMQSATVAAYETSKGDVTRLNSACSALEGPLQDAERAFAVARERLDNLRGTFAVYDAQRHEAKRRLIRSLVGALPIELLEQIFLFTCADDEKGWSTKSIDSYNLLRARLPFALAAVCKRWRQSATKLPPLWSFIQVPAVQDAREGFEYMLHVRVQLKRSKRSPLVILVACASCHWDDVDWFQKIISELVQHTDRWRLVRLRLPKGVQMGHISFLRLSMPLLVDLHLESYNDHAIPWSTPAPIFLQHSKGLQRLNCEVTFVLPYEPFAALSEAVLYVDNSSLASLWTAMQRMPALQDLYLSFCEDVDVATYIPPASDLHLSSLKTLSLGGQFSVVGTWVNLFHGPPEGIECLDVYITSSEELLDVMPFFMDTCACITSLRVSVDDDYAKVLPVTRDFVAAFQGFSCVREVVFDECEFDDSEFFAGLDNWTGPNGGQAPSPIWPSLEDMSLLRTTITKTVADTFIHFIQGRVKTRSDAASPQTFTLSISHNYLPVYTSPDWMLWQLAGFLGDSFSFHGTPLTSLCLDSDDDSESDAAFTEDDHEATSGGSESDGVEIVTADFDSHSGPSGDSDYDPGMHRLETRNMLISSHRRVQCRRV